jgi:hypothetical protein
MIHPFSAVDLKVLYQDKWPPTANNRGDRFLVNFASKNPRVKGIYSNKQL